MRQKIIFATAIMLLAGFASVFAGEGYKCTASMDACVNQMSAKYQNSGWIGIETEKTGEHMFSKIIKVVSDSPAERAGFKVGDVLVAVNGTILKEENKAAIKSMKKSMTAGQKAKFTVKRGNHDKILKATLAAPPSDVLAQWVGNHVLKSHADATKVATN